MQSENLIRFIRLSVFNRIHKLKFCLIFFFNFKLMSELDQVSNYMLMSSRRLRMSRTVPRPQLSVGLPLLLRRPPVRSLCASARKRASRVRTVYRSTHAFTCWSGAFVRHISLYRSSRVRAVITSRSTSIRTSALVTSASTSQCDPNRPLSHPTAPTF